MADLASIMAETSKSYDNSRNALKKQINAISGDLAAQKDRINAQYAQQQKTLDNQRNYQAQASSMSASRNGGSFGGANEIANKKYYQQAYVPAVTQMQTNQANDLSSAESQANSNRLSLQTQLAQLNDEASRYAMQRYDNALQLEEQKRQFDAQLAAQKAAQAAQNNLYRYLYGGGAGGSSNPYTYDSDASGGKNFYNSKTGKNVKFGTYYTGAGGAWNNNSVLNAVGQVFGKGSNEYNRLSEILKYNGNRKLSQNTGSGYSVNNQKYLSTSDRSLLNRLGLKLG